MNFKNWIYNELSGSNAYHRMVQQHPDYQGMPDHVRKEFINSAFGHSINSSFQKSQGQQINPSEFLAHSPYKSRKWDKKPNTFQVTPLNFDDWTLNIFVGRCFGLRPMPTIRNDAERFSKQQQMLNTENGNEPVIILQNKNKFKLQEGWHRTMAMLLWDGRNDLGAPADQIAILKRYAEILKKIDQTYADQDVSSNSHVRMEWLQKTAPIVEQLKGLLDFTKWTPVPIRAYAGQSDDAQPIGHNPWDATTAVMPTEQRSFQFSNFYHQS